MFSGSSQDCFPRGKSVASCLVFVGVLLEGGTILSRPDPHAKVHILQITRRGSNETQRICVYLFTRPKAHWSPFKAFPHWHPPFRCSQPDEAGEGILQVFAVVSLTFWPADIVAWIFLVMDMSENHVSNGGIERIVVFFFYLKG